MRKSLVSPTNSLKEVAEGEGKKSGIYIYIYIYSGCLAKIIFVNLFYYSA